MSVHKTSTFRFYEELNDFLDPALRKRCFEHRFDGTPSVKDRIEALGVPHTEVDLVLVDGQASTFNQRLRGGERVAVYPVFECFDIGELSAQPARPLRELRFVLDVHLGRLAAYLRLLGFDCLYRRDLDDAEIVDLSCAQHRIILSRDVGLLKNRRVTHGAFVHATDPVRQLREMLERFQIQDDLDFFSRCMKCNALLESIGPDELEPGAVPRDVLARFERFDRCTGCRKIYWLGSHVERMRKRLARAGIRLPDPARRSDPD
ncbi:MAG: Mut7-C RNAse domain-containing protein [Wenzhouxiangellaceae bacterium]|nr:Mut7-C RNAse domain-containing protein [Wenzhouxiangellaceae bacterium]